LTNRLNNRVRVILNPKNAVSASKCHDRTLAQLDRAAPLSFVDTPGDPHIATGLKSLISSKKQ
jgi:hypothetical protein